MQIRRLASFIAAVLAASIVGGDAVGGPVTLAAPTRGRIIAFSQDGGRIAWIGYRERVHIKTLWNGRSAVIESERTFPGGAGGWPSGFREHLLGLAGRRVVWNVRRGGNCLETLVYTATLDKPSPRRIYSMGFCHDSGTMPTGIAGDGVTLVFTLAEFEYEPGPPEFEPGRGCTRVSSGRTARVVGSRKVTVPGSVPAVGLAVSAGRVALVPADPTCTDLPGVLAPAPNGTVEIRSGDGALVSSFSPAGTVRALALSPATAVVLVEASDRSRRVERYDAATGRLLGATPVQPITANNLDIAGGWIVYRTGRAIRLIDAVTGAKRLLVIAPATPLGLSIEHRRVAWAENRLGHGRVRSVLAPAHPQPLDQKSAGVGAYPGP
jgi:hypothetical protein